MEAATPPAASQIHPFTVCVTEYVAAVVTVIAEAAAPLLHNKGPLYPDVDNTELPQLFTTVTTSEDGIALGAATPLLEGLVHPFTVWVTV